MSRKGFLVKVELDVQKVTCPGVWLCSNGKVSLQIYMLDSSIQTSSCKPTFPIYFHEKFVFYKTFTEDQRLNELQRSLNNEWFYAELVQWQSCNEGCVLATFQTTLDDLLYPSSFRRVISGMDIDLLMEPTELFPGTIAPKLEIGTKTTIEETLCDIDVETPSTVLCNPKLLLSTQSPPRKSRPKKVCHSIAFSRALKNVPPKQKRNRPIFQYRKVSDDLILRNNPNVVLKPTEETLGQHPIERASVTRGCNCYCNLRSRSMENLLPNQPKFVYRRASPENINRKLCKGCTKCNYERSHGDMYCPICNKYQDLFTPNSSNNNSVSTNNVYTKVYKPSKLCSHCKRMAKFHVRSSTGSACESDVSDSSKKKVCFCLPKETANSLAQQLHERLSRTLESNRRFINNCMYCEDTAE
ncbi:spermatogenesis-associated protein 6 isoform X2 [Anoplophora glabripennis]|uniref:spermatogenesis-associated protein 6 isoform X2 n=1 Tax=Anoplophora glabripennis TaxID=217634 RepID=UPI000873794C|nr:spermatogenesis-associated protein 6 isoform X2 [Anoplophora glabripennis]